MADTTIARLTIYGASRFTPDGRKKIADWLRHHADTLESEGHEYSNRFTGRFLVSNFNQDKNNAGQGKA